MIRLHLNIQASGTSQIRATRVISRFFDAGSAIFRLPSRLNYGKTRPRVP